MDSTLPFFVCLKGTLLLRLQTGSEYRKAFFLTYPDFVSHRNLIEMLIQRYENR